MIPSPPISLAALRLRSRHQSITRCQLTSTPAATSPPVRLVSGPTIAFWTALAMIKSSTKSNVDIWPSWRGPVRRSATSSAA